MQHTGVAASDATVLWVQVATLLALAWLLGGLARRLGQPPIVGSLVAGLLAGPSVFGQLWPSGFHWFRPGTQLHAGLLASIADFALLILLIGLGAETDLRLISRAGRRAAAVIGSSLALPIAAGVVVAAALPVEFMGAHPHRVAFVLLIAAAMTVSSLPVIARMVTEMGITRRDVGQLSFAAATVNDGVGFIVLAVAMSLVDGGGLAKLIIAVAGLLGLVAVSATGGQRALDWVLRRTRREGPDVAGAVAAAVVFTFVIAAVGQAAGVDAALGAFLAGVVIGRSRYLPRRALDVIRAASDAVFAPLYFATAGVSVDVTLLGHGGAGWWFLLVLVIAVVSKFVGVVAGGKLAALPAPDAVALGVVLNGRGALQVILATAGLTAGILSPAAFTVIILVSIVPSVIVAPSLRRILRGWRGSAEERARLEREEQMATNVVVRGQRALLPTRGSSNSVAAARILDLAWPPETDVTLLHVDDPRRSEQGVEHVRQMLSSREIQEESAGDDNDLVAAVLSEANLGYGIIAVGAAEHPDEQRPLPRVIEELLSHSPIPLLVVRRGSALSTSDGCPVIRPRRILVPVTGTAASRAGVEVARTISRNTGAEIHLMHVVTRGADGATRASGLDRSAKAVVADARREVSEDDLPVVATTDTADSAGSRICAEAVNVDADIVVVGTTVRRVDGRPFLGHTVEHLLDALTDPTVVAVVLPDAQQAAADEHIDRRAG
jgi:Kef-type K+ transport system membrane component KefB